MRVPWRGRRDRPTVFVDRTRGHDDPVCGRPLAGHAPQAVGRNQVVTVVILLREGGENSRIVRASIDESGLVIEGHDMGPLVEQIFGDSDYEYWYRVPTTRLDDFAARIGAEPDTILPTLESDWSGPKYYDLVEILRDPDLGIRFHSH